jgi:ABC-type phosphate transport system substrate-binding protein
MVNPAQNASGWNLLSRNKGEIAMKAVSLFVAGLAVAMLSTVSANAQSRVATTSATALATTTGNCSTTTDFTVSPVPCTKAGARNYVECTERVAKNGGRSTDGWWWCTNQGFKN